MPQLDKIKTELNTWLDTNWSPDLSLKLWRERLVDGGWACVQWPADFFGRGYGEEQAALVQDVFAEREVVGAAQSGPR
ncbi:MAG: hypothetical protein ACJA0W_002131, partial [Candidatus Azotimanducaceae bacterium]